MISYFKICSNDQFCLVNFGGKLPLQYYNYINEEMSKKDEKQNYGNQPGINQDVANPNAINRPFAWPIKIKSSMPKDDQVAYYPSVINRIVTEAKWNLTWLFSRFGTKTSPDNNFKGRRPHQNTASNLTGR